MQKNRAFFLDRDGVIIKNVPYLNQADGVEFLPGVDQAIKIINKSGYMCIAITNQSGIARGLISMNQLFSIHDHIKKSLAKNGAIINAFYFCPHHPDGVIEQYAISCNCRKPGAGMIYKAAHEHNLELSVSIVVGDQDIDTKAAKIAGCKTFQLYKPTVLDGEEVVFRSLEHLISYIL